ncbi:MAG: class I SAM-dependent DNA methyltransferase, partial [Eggerthellaceae bacterium]|nr:class I SAM-dependent DNA methyltransferase [Eggerthellaceae bacterium]
MATLIADKYAAWEAECEERFNRLKANEEELNRIFAEIYDMVGEVPIEVEDKYVSVRKADLQREIRSLLSYAVGCMMGRYSLDEDGLILADQGATRADYLARIPNPTYMPDDDAIIPITDEDYFGDDDIVAHAVEFFKAAYGEETLEENLRYVADALGGEGKPAREVIREYFLKDFYKDHLQVYKKRPIYWMFDSGKKNGFKCLIYMHRYTPDMLARIRTDYVHEQQERYRTQIANVEGQIGSASKGQLVALQKRLKKLQEQLKETSEFEERIPPLADQMIASDLDDGVKVNYAK